MLINLSNHPKATWSNEQIEVAQTKYGEITDMEFPYIPPHFTEKQVTELAQEYHKKIIDLYGNGIIVHLMGELCFCFALLTLLKKSNIKVVASTTERVVKQNNNNEKIVSFNFVKFREYT